MNKIKIFNDPVYGFIRFPYEIIYELINHPFFQRLRRISQLGLSHYVYPGAIHSRFHHALGATHLMLRAVNTLREKNIEITESEAEAACIAMLLHDIGHGPISHSLEYRLIPFHHEEISLAFMHELNRQLDGRLETAIAIFEKKYHKSFLTQLVSSQLDMDRMDYLNRDSFFTGVAEGIIGYDRIIKMFNVVDDQLLIEEKAIYSIEKFLMARRIMYWQVYLHKTVIAVEQMLLLFWNQMKKNWTEIQKNGVPSSLNFFLNSNPHGILLDRNTLLEYAKLDDYDVFNQIKKSASSSDYILQYMSNSLLNRKLFKIRIQSQPFDSEQIEHLANQLSNKLGLDIELANQLIVMGSESNRTYDKGADEIHMLMKNGDILKFSEVTDFRIREGDVQKHFLCAPDY